MINCWHCRSNDLFFLLLELVAKALLERVQYCSLVYERQPYFQGRFLTMGDKKGANNFGVIVAITLTLTLTLTPPLTLKPGK